LPNHRQNVPEPLQEFDKEIRAGTFKADLLSICESLTDIQRPISAIVQLVNLDFSVPLFNTLRPHLAHLADFDQQLPAHQGKWLCLLVVDGVN
jgi:hypothetical protein